MSWCNPCLLQDWFATAAEMGNRWARWRSLSWRDRGYLLVCVHGLAVIHGLLACFGYKRTHKLVEFLTRRNVTHAANPAEIAEARALAHIAAIASRHGMVEATCLRRSLLLHGWLRRRGLRPSLRFGVSPQGGPEFEAHAWIELEGVRLLRGDEAYRPFRAGMP